MYTTPEKVVIFTGVTHEDLQLESNAVLLTTIDDWIEQATDLINQNRNRDYYGNVPPGIENICLRMVANMVGYAVQRRNTTTVSHDDYDVRLIEDKMMTPSVIHDLKQYPQKPRFRLFVPKESVIEEEEPVNGD